jgi:hypothetical protein
MFDSGLVLMDCSFPLLLLVQSSLDLNERRKHRLGPKRVVISAGLALALLVIAFGIWTTCYLGTAWRLQVNCPNNYIPISYYAPGFIYAPDTDGYTPVIDLSPYLPFVAILDTIL